ncbi:hypothetical protein FSARC_14407, partial [Fusarium sarcochroum]
MRYSVAAALLASSAMATDVSKVYETKRVTITSCGPEVTNCPARSTVVSTTSYPVPPKVTSAQEPVDTTEEVPEVPATEETPEVPTTEAPEVPMTTSTIYSTNVKTITSCGPEVKNCPATGGTPAVVTETIAVSTTICPVTEQNEQPKPTKPAETQPGYEQPPAPPADTKPATEGGNKPHETQPGYEQPPAPPAETKPVETQPGNEQPPAPPAETKPAETQPGYEQPPAPPAETKPVET